MVHLQIHKNYLAIDCGNGFIFCPLLDSITSSVVGSNPTSITKFTKNFLVDSMTTMIYWRRRLW